MTILDPHGPNCSKCFTDELVKGLIQIITDSDIANCDSPHIAAMKMGAINARARTILEKAKAGL